MLSFIQNLVRTLYIYIYINIYIKENKENLSTKENGI